ncbi:Repetin [Streptomyces sp. HNM0575]|uniref:Repetin n=1 Tax=Streptomyces sp. HNM0575 TaxID=2716338 RepID=UPI00145F7DC8|nr:Repetin [Streptomyces sp. HNM0575]NLU74672.1 Repetin [Streptomyces sp. HNM0575]
MNRRVMNTTRVIALGATLLMVTGFSGAGAATATGAGAGAGATRQAGHGRPDSQGREAAALTGSAKMFRKTTEDVTFTFDAHLAAADRNDPSRATGTFRFVHLDKPGGKGAYAEGHIDCLMTGGKVATVTGVVTGTDLPQILGKRVGFTVQDRGGRDRVGYSWAPYGGTPDQPDELAKCASSAPYEKVRRGTGDFRVLPWKFDYPTDDG